ncbi:MAG: DegT/DnrJ/EryC1/StrS family aminotransferase [Candidatus Aerophobetes bacterium]|nr:DegT/DnrJ/EryC1/StrS family aminotransferase [Candidatus Aerophobetes bacterium]
MQVPLLNLKAQYKKIKDEINSSLSRVVERQLFILGPEVEDLERRIASYSEAKFAIGVASGSDALLLSLRALGVGYKDKVITSPFTFFATAGMIHNVGARPLFVDVKPDTFNIDPERLLGCVEEICKQTNNRLKAIIPVHLFGQMADMDPIIALARKYKIKIIEDAAQSIGAEYNGYKAGSIGDLGCFSFYPSKNLGGYGDGGMIVTSDEGLAHKVRMLRAHGEKSKYIHSFIGYNSRLDALQAAILRVKLKYLDDWSKKREENARYYNKRFIEEELASKGSEKEGSGNPLILSCTIKERRHIYHQYVIRVKKGLRDALQNFLKENGIGTAIYYPLPLHLQECFRYLGYKSGDFPVAEKISEEVLSLPIYPELTRKMQDYVVDKIKEFFKKESSE